MVIRSQTLSLLFVFAAGIPATIPVSAALYAQAPASTSQRGTVKSVSASGIVIATDTNAELTVTPSDSVRILQLAPGSTDLKSAQTITLSDISAGDRVLITGHPGDTPTSIVAVRIILMKSADIASLHASQSSDWQRRGTGGIVKSVSGNTVTVSNGARLLTVTTTPNTIFRRYGSGSVKFEDAKPGTIADLSVGDQLRVRGAKSDDGSSITAEEIVSGAFENLAGALSRVDPAAGTVTLKDLGTKQTYTVSVTANSDLRHLPATAAASFTRNHADTGPAAAATPSGTSQTGSSRRAGTDLSQMLSHLPTQPIADLHPGDAVLIVASRASTGPLTAVTLLSGVEQILTASAGASAPTLSPWNLSTGEGEAAAGGGAR